MLQNNHFHNLKLVLKQNLGNNEVAEPQDTDTENDNNEQGRKTIKDLVNQMKVENMVCSFIYSMLIANTTQYLSR